MNFFHNNLVLVALLASTLVVVLVLAIVVSAALRGGGAAGSGTAVKTLRLLGVESLRLSFRKAVKLVEANLASSSERYNLSWTLLLNDSAGADVPLLQAGLPSALSSDSNLSAAAQGIDWQFFDKGLVVQLRTQYLGESVEGENGDGVWDAFIGLCRNYRPQRPFDAIVLAIPCAALLETDPQGQRDLVARAQALHRRLWLAQNRLALRMPIHLMVTECERIPGFASFGAALPDALRRSILGWASPHELVAPFRGQWVDQAMDEVVGAVADSCAELCALAPGEQDSSAYFLLPTELERLRAGLKLFCEELMRPSAYHEAFLLRGIYLTGDASAAAVLQGAQDAQDAPAAPGEAAPVRMPVFLRDIFERKIFPEVGLVRSSAQRLRRPAARHAAYWVAVLVPLVWGVSLAVGTWQLHQKQVEVMTWLQGPGRLYRGTAEGYNVAAAQRRAVSALEQVDRIGTLHFYSLAMPGSWPLFDDLEARRHARLEQGFGAHAVEALRTAAVARLRQLTGAGYDPATRRLLYDGQCTLPDGWLAAVAAAPAGLELNSLAEYQGVVGFVDNIRQLDQAVRAMRRLGGPASTPPAGADLQLAMRLLLGREVPATLSGAAQLYREAAEDGKELSDADMGDPANCTFRLAVTAMYARLFEKNPLLVAETDAGAALARLRSGGAEPGGQVAAWQALHTALAAEQVMLVQGQGAWMHQGELNLGRAQDELVKRLRATRLLGDAAAQDAQAIASQGFAGFQHAWTNVVAVNNRVDSSGGLAWGGKGWAFTPERKALLDAFTALLAPSWMKPAAPLVLPSVPRDSAIHWDKAQVDRVAGLMDARKAFHAGAYVGLPTSLQPAAASLVDAVLVDAAGNGLAQAMMLSGPELPGLAADAERAGVLAIRTWLQDLGARELVGRIDAALAADAHTRLERLDAVLRAADVYTPRDPAFRQWQGKKGVMVEAFGAGDAAALNLYLEQQKEFIDTIGTQADGVLNVLVSNAPPGPDGHGLLPPLVATWQALRTDLLRYRQNSPASSRLALENFIRTGSADIELANCAEKLTQRQLPKRAADLFDTRLHVLQDGVLQRCRELAGTADQRQWQQFAEAYNRDLAQRAPFAVAPGTKPGQWVMAADRDAVGAALKLYDSARAASALAVPVAGTTAYRADPQLRRLRDLLAPLFPADDTQAGGLDVAVEFRANPQLEAGGNKIIEWRLAIGAAALRQGEPARSLHWEPGMPVTLSLRFARDGGVAPQFDAARPGMVVHDRTVSFRFDDPWALFSFINAYRDGDVPGDDGRAPLLRFAFGLAPDGEARVYLRLRVSAPGRLTPLAWPSALPAPLPLANDPPKTAYEPTP